MKKVLSFVALFVLAILVAYGQAAFFPYLPEAKKEVTPAVQQVNTLPYETIDDNDYSGLVGKSSQQLQKKLGTPQATYNFTATAQVFTYGTGVKDYLQVYLDHDIVTALYVLGTKFQQGPFADNMTIEELSKAVPLTANFRLDFLEEPVSFELSEEELNYRPLVAFKSGAFGIGYLDQESGKLVGVAYLAPAILLEDLPYTLTEGQLPYEEKEAPLDVARNNQEKALLYRQMVTVLREKLALAPFKEEAANNSALLSATQNLAQNYRNYFDDEEAHDFQASQVISQLSFELTDKRAASILQELGLPEARGAFIRVPAADPLERGLKDFTTGSLQKLYHAEEETIFSVAFQYNVMVVLMTEDKISTTNTSQEGSP